MRLRSTLRKPEEQPPIIQLHTFNMVSCGCTGESLERVFAGPEAMRSLAFQARSLSLPADARHGRRSAEPAR